MIFTTKSPEETEEIGHRLASFLYESGERRAFVALFGEMGVGKTAFVRGFCRGVDALGVRSPTYTIVNEYRGKLPIYHFDMYRIESADDLASIGFDEYVYSDGYSLAEWSENIVDELPPWAVSVRISRCEGDVSLRKIEIDTEDEI